MVNFWKGQELIRLLWQSRSRGDTKKNWKEAFFIAG